MPRPRGRPSKDIEERIWEKVKREYITTDCNQTQVCEKYGVTRASFHERSSREKWFDQKQAYRKSVMSKALDRISDVQADRIVKAIEIGDKLLDKISEMIDYIGKPKEVLDLTSALKNLSDIKLFVNVLDKEEQEARIAKLRKECEEESAEDRTITVVFQDDDLKTEGGIDEFTN